MPYPTHTIRITTSTYATVEYLNDINDNIRAMVYDVYHAKGNASSLNAKLKTFLTTAGNVKSNAIKHVQLGNVTPDQHHKQYHGGSHTDGVDNVLVANTTAKGLVSATVASKINTIASSAGRMQVATFSYNGNNVATGQYISLGFRPLHVMIFWDNDPVLANTSAWGGKSMTETLWGCSNSFRHQIEWGADSGIEHRSKPVASSVKITTYGVKVYGYLNKVSVGWGNISKYHCFAYRYN